MAHRLWFSLAALCVAALSAFGCSDHKVQLSAVEQDGNVVVVYKPAGRTTTTEIPLAPNADVEAMKAAWRAAVPQSAMNFAPAPEAPRQMREFFASPEWQERLYERIIAKLSADAAAAGLTSLQIHKIPNAKEQFWQILQEPDGLVETTYLEYVASK